GSERPARNRRATASRCPVLCRRRLLENADGVGRSAGRFMSALPGEVVVDLLIAEAVGFVYPPTRPMRTGKNPGRGGDDVLSPATCFPRQRAAGSQMDRRANGTPRGKRNQPGCEGQPGWDCVGPSPPPV